MAARVEAGGDYMSHHINQSKDDTLAAGSCKTLTFTTTESPKTSMPMSLGRKISAYIITVSHLFALYALYDMFFVLDIVKGLKWFAAAMIFYHFTGIQGITAGSHRLWAHRSYSASLPVRIWLMMMNSIANQGSILQWSTDHRVHHIHVDTDADPHNINRGFFFAHMGWLFSARTDAWAEAKKQVEIRDLEEDPVVAIQDKYYMFFGPFFCYILPALMGMWYADDAWRGFLYLGHLRWVACLHATWCINSVSHVFGTRPYRPDMKATDNLFTSIFSGGEGWHNYHHAYAYDYAAAEQTSLLDWNDPSGVTWRFNAARFYIDFFALLGGVSNRKVARNIKKVPLQNPTQATKINPLMRDDAKKVH